MQATSTTPYPTAPASPGPQAAQTDPLAGLDRLLDRLLGADLRWLYGLAVPMFAVFGVIVLVSFHHSIVWAGAALVLEAALLALIVVKSLAILGEEDDARD